jgi:LysR family transcriptional regulator (chromosome initiation inhibitor)
VRKVSNFKEAGGMLSMFDYKLLDALWAVIREGSFEGASARLNVSPSAISQRIKLLENRARKILIIRSKPCEATEAGYVLFAHMEQVKLLEIGMQEEFNTGESTANNAPPVLRIGVSGDSMNTWFNRVIIEFCATENVLFHIVRDDREYTVDALKKGEVIATVIPRDRAVEGLKSLPLGRLEYSAVVSPELYTQFFDKGITPAALTSMRAIAFDEKDSLPSLWMEHTFGKRIVVESHRVPSFTGYIEACRSGIGWGIAPSLALAPLIKSGELIELQPNSRISSDLIWQYSTISSNIIDKLTKKVAEVAKRTLIVLP